MIEYFGWSMEIDIQGFQLKSNGKCLFAHVWKVNCMSYNNSFVKYLYWTCNKVITSWKNSTEHNGH